MKMSVASTCMGMILLLLWKNISAKNAAMRMPIIQERPEENSLQYIGHVCVLYVAVEL